jgi:hypothetical protein
MRLRFGIGQLAIALLLPLLSVPPPPAAAGGGAQLPIFRVVDAGLTRREGARLDRVLHLDGRPRPAAGSLLYADPQRFLFVPGKPVEGGQGDEDAQALEPRALQTKKIKKLGALSKRKAMGMVHDAMDDAGIELREDFNLKSSFKVTHTFLDLYSPEGNRQAHEPLDTQVRARLSLGGLPLIGPGASFAIGFGAHQSPKKRDVVSTLSASLYEVKKGPMASLMSEAEAANQCSQRFQAQVPRGLSGPMAIDTRLVYYAPPLELGVDALYPHYECRGSVESTGGRADFRPVLISAALLTPRVTIEAGRSEFLTVFGSANVTGGTPPFRYVWTSSTTTLPTPEATAGPSISYNPRPRDELEHEILNVWVADANDLTATASIDLGENKGALPPPGPTGAGPVEVGTEWVGLSQGLGGSWGNANGFASTMAAQGFPVQFNFGDFAAWEEDFKFPAAGGTDIAYADDVDLTFYTGHAGSWGFTFPGNHDDGGLDFTEAQWGDRDVEWMAIAACGPLQEVDDAGRALTARWGPAFQGLHALLGYSTISYDNDVEGRFFADNLFGFRFFGARFSMTVVQAWVQMAMDAQPDLPAPDTVMWAAMGPIGPGGVSNLFDNFWGEGPFGTGPDIPASSITGFWVLRGAA